jgi:lipoprotein-releasing system permease protein
VLQQALFTGAAGAAHGGVLRGIDLREPGMAAELRSQVRAGDLAALERGEPVLLLGRELARSLGVMPGDSVTAISPSSAMTAIGVVPRMRRYLVAATIEMGMYEYDASVAYAPLATAQEFAGLSGRVTGVEVKLDDPFAARQVGRQITAALGWPYWVRDWMEMNKNLFAALQLEKLALFVIVTIIVLVAAFAIIGHLVLLVAEKRKEIGILKAVGASARSITIVFFSVGMTIGIVGAAAGSAVGLALMWVQNTYRLIRLSGDVYPIDHLPMKLSGGDVAMIVGATLAISLAATVFPARRAGSLAPADVLRYE